MLSDEDKRALYLFNREMMATFGVCLKDKALDKVASGFDSLTKAKRNIYDMIKGSISNENTL